jgi:hypothetical protein
MLYCKGLNQHARHSGAANAAPFAAAARAYLPPSPTPGSCLLLSSGHSRPSPDKLLHFFYAGRAGRKHTLKASSTIAASPLWIAACSAEASACSAANSAAPRSSSAPNGIVTHEEIKSARSGERRTCHETVVRFKRLEVCLLKLKEALDELVDAGQASDLREGVRGGGGGGRKGGSYLAYALHRILQRICPVLLFLGVCFVFRESRAPIAEFALQLLLLLQRHVAQRATVASIVRWSMKQQQQQQQQQQQHTRYLSNDGRVARECSSLSLSSNAISTWFSSRHCPTNVFCSASRFDLVSAIN